MALSIELARYSAPSATRGFDVYYSSATRKTLPNGTQSLIWVEEQVSLPLTKQRYTNHYWLDPTSGKVIASEQRLGPNGSQLALSIAKPFAGE
ncbi:YjbF family lipoprotein [Vibrio metschnikovii]